VHSVAERPSEAFEANLHDVPIVEADVFAKAQRAGAEIVHMHVSRSAVEFELKVMMLDVSEAVAHLRFTCANCLRPEKIAAPPDVYGARDRFEYRINDKFRAKRAHAQFRASEIEVVFLLEYVIGKLVAGGHAQTIRLPVWGDDVTCGDLGFFTAVLGIGGNEESLPMCAKRRTIALVEPLGSDPDDTGIWLARCDSPLKYAHAIGEFVFVKVMHSIPVAGAPKVGEAGAGDEAASGFYRMIDGRQKMPGRLAGVDRIIGERLRSEILMDECREAAILPNGCSRERVD
jgi:hypothetical protein